MGQQQLLLVILVTIIVGIATVVAINTFGSAADSANVDAVRTDISQIAAAAQAQYQKPEALGGAGQKFTTVTFRGMAFPGDITDSGTDLHIVNQNGTYVLSGGSADDITLKAYPASDPAYDGNPASGDGTTAAKATSSGGAFTVTITKGNLDITTEYTPSDESSG